MRFCDRTLGLAYRALAIPCEGNGVPQDDVNAIKWFQRAVSRGHIGATEAAERKAKQGLSEEPLHGEVRRC